MLRVPSAAPAPAAPLFQVGEGPAPERPAFDEIVDGRALRAVWSGHPFFRP